MCPFISYFLYTLAVNGLTAGRRCSLPLPTSASPRRPKSPSLDALWLPTLFTLQCPRYDYNLVLVSAPILLQNILIPFDETL
jgi:hypothetical protein